MGWRRGQAAIPGALTTPSETRQPGSAAKLPDLAVAAFEDIIDCTAADVTTRFDARLPDLSDITVLLPDTSLAHHFRACLLKRLPSGCEAVLAPTVTTLPQWINRTIAADDGRTVISSQARRLLFIEALNAEPGLFREENKWQVADALLSLFDELVLNDVSQLDADASDWLHAIKQAYAVDIDIEQLNREAGIVYTLWQAWQEQLGANDLIDSTGIYSQRLCNAAGQIADDVFVYAVNLEQPARLERALLEDLGNRGRCLKVRFDMTLESTETAAPQTRVHRFVHAGLAHEDGTLLERVAAYRSTETCHDLPLSLFLCGDAEHEARAVDVQVRRWLLEGKNRIGIVSEDRKLSRRVRALLERANIRLRDLAGWSLATTSAASIIERWLECIEEDFDYRPMLDVLKSPFFNNGEEPDLHLQNIYRLENDIIHNEQVAHGIARYRRQLASRSARLHGGLDDNYAPLGALLDLLDAASHPLVQLFKSRRPVPAGTCIRYLFDSLERLGIRRSLEDDEAGRQILEALEAMRFALETAEPALLWRDFRTWIGLTLEEALFNPADRDSPVSLMSLSQSDGHRFDAVILAAADRQHLPGSPVVSPFFNQQVRRSLHLPDWQQQKALRLQQFERLLQSAPEVLISCKHEENGEPLPLSPWVEALRVFYRQTRGRELAADALDDLLRHDTDVFACDTAVLPDPPQRPMPFMQSALLPGRLSAGAHQRLIDCPYRFFAGDALKLRAPEEVIEELRKSDYGNRIHTILQAFHTPVKGMPPPFDAPLTENNREAAIAHMERLSRQVFMQDLEDNSLHRSWLYRWEKRIPEYIDWQISQEEWNVSRTETRFEVPLANGMKLYGILDRIDTRDGQQRIIDYKTGNAPAQDRVDSAEDVQLVSYALLDPDATEVAYLQLDPSQQRVGIKSRLEGESLDALRQAVSDRLETMLEMQRDNSPMPAWGDSATCAYCDYIGLCRRKVWSDGC